MERSEYYQADVGMFFGEKKLEQTLYERLFARMEEAFPDALVKVQKSQISFYHKHLFAAVSLPVRRKKDWPERCVVVTIGLSRPLESPRAAVSVEPYPGRWTNHVLLAQEEEIDEELLAWLREAYDFALAKGGKKQAGAALDKGAAAPVQ